MKIGFDGKKSNSLLYSIGFAVWGSPPIILVGARIPLTSSWLKRKLINVIVDSSWYRSSRKGLPSSQQALIPLKNPGCPYISARIEYNNLLQMNFIIVATIMDSSKLYMLTPNLISCMGQHSRIKAALSVGL